MGRLRRRRTTQGEVSRPEKAVSRLVWGEAGAGPAPGAEPGPGLHHLLTQLMAEAMAAAGEVSVRGEGGEVTWQGLEPLRGKLNSRYPGFAKGFKWPGIKYLDSPNPCNLGYNIWLLRTFWIWRAELCVGSAGVT